MKLLLAGPASIHTTNFLKLVFEYFQEIVILTSAPQEMNMDCKNLVLNPSLRNPFSIPAKLSEMRKILHRINPDIIHVHQADTMAWLILRASRKSTIPVVVTAWGSDVLLNAGRSAIHRKMLRYILRNADALTADAEVVQSRIRNLTPCAADVVLSSFGIEIPEVISEKENLIYSNRLHKPLYRIDKTIMAFSKFIAGRDEKWKMVMAGTGEQTAELKKLTEELGIDKAVEFVGWVDHDQNWSYYERAKIFVSIPESDATSVSLLEAMAMGCIPVVSDLPANNQWVQHKLSGLIVSNPDSDFFHDALAIDAVEAAKINRNLVKEKASTDVARRIFTGIYEKLLSLPE